MKTSEMVEGPEAYKRFDSLMANVLKVPHSIVQARVQEERERAARNPNRRGPKAKTQRKRKA
jgi:hypothetical protein